MTTHGHSHAVPRTVGWRRTATMLAIAIGLVALASGTVHAQAPETETGVRTLPSADGFTATVERLEDAIADEGLTLLHTIDHAANARNEGLELAPTTVLLFGNPQVGTPLMQTAPTFALDLPQRMLVWQDDNGDVFVTWRNPRVLAEGHGVAPDHAPLPDVGALLETLARIAAATQ